MNQYVHVGAATLHYDGDGNLVHDGAAAYRFDAEGRLIEVNHKDLGIWTYEYNAQGQRIAATHDGETRRYLYDPAGLGSVIAECDEAGNVLVRYVHGVSLTARISENGVRDYYAFDASGNTRLVLGEEGAVLASYAYSPFGTPLQVEEALDNPFTFGGASGIMKEDNGLYFMRARYLHPDLGRFLSPDPIGLLGGWNGYVYAGNDPVNNSDPSGLDAVAPGGAWNSQITGPTSFSLEHPMLEVSYEQQQQLAFAVSEGQPFAGLPQWNMLANYYLFSGMNKAKEQLRNAADLFRSRRRMGEGLFRKGRAYAQTPFNRVPFDIKWLIDAAQPQEPPVVFRTEVITPNDPNEKLAPEGVGAAHMINGEDAIAYTIFFENIATASAPAQEVFVVDHLDGALDIATLTLTEAAWGDYLLSMPADSASFAGRQSIGDYRVGANKTWFVDLVAGMDSATNALTWVFRTIDPETGDLPEDAEAGFLPPNDASHRGQGHVSFTIKPKAGVPLGTVVRNKASIVFDANASIETNETLNAIGEVVKPRAAFAADARAGFAPLTVHFSDASQSGSAPVTDYIWRFGDGSTSNESNPIHVYETAGAYAVSLTVMNSLGVDTFMEPGFIVVEALPVPVVYAVDPASGPASGGAKVVISGMNLDDPISVLFGGASAAVVAATAARIEVETAPSAPGLVDVAVVTAYGEALLPQAYAFVSSNEGEGEDEGENEGEGEGEGEGENEGETLPVEGELSEGEIPEEGEAPGEGEGEEEGGGGCAYRGCTGCDKGPLKRVGSDAVADYFLIGILFLLLLRFRLPR